MGTGGSTQLSPLDFFLRSTRVSVPSKLYRRQMEHFRVMAKLHMLSTFVCLAAACGGQRQPITCALRAWFLGRFRIRPVTQSAFASWTGQQRSTSANRAALSACALGTFSHASPFANRLHPYRVCLLVGLCESSPRHISTGRLHALRRFHSPPINLIVFEVPYRIAP